VPPAADEVDAVAGVPDALDVPELAVVIVVADDAVAGCPAAGGVAVGPLKFSGPWPCSIAGVTTQSPPSELRHTVSAACELPAVTR